MRHINLRFPRTWNQCTASELEQIAEITRDRLERADCYHPFNIQDVKLALFFLFAELTIVRPLYSNGKIDGYEVIRNCDMKWYHRLGRFFGIESALDNIAFPIQLWQLSYWINGELQAPVPEDSSSVKKKQKVKSGIFDWLDSDNPNGLTFFPYPTVKCRKRKTISIFNHQFSIRSLRKKTFASPGSLFATASYQQYRTAQDYMQLYTLLQNKAIEDAKKNNSNAALSLRERTGGKALLEAKAKFLATIFNAKVEYIDEQTGMPQKGYHYTSTQADDNFKYFLDFPDAKFQVLLFWWSGIMRYLASKFPHVFKTTPIKKGEKSSSPLDIYTNSIAVLQKYTSQTEESLNKQLHTVTLKDLDNMIRESEELEKISKKK